MKATGEVMSIGRNLEESLLKSRSLSRTWYLSSRAKSLKRT